MTSINSRPEVGENLRVFCGIDWAERHHDIALIGQDGGLIAKRRINDGPDGFDELTAMLTAAGDSVEDPIPVAIETPRGLLVAALRATARPVFAINPMAVARYRERHSVARAKSDHADAMTLANILRTDSHAHRKMPADTNLAQAIAVLARATQDAIWRRTRATLELRSLLREYYPGFLAAFARAGNSGVTNLAGSDARHVLALAPSPAAGARISVARIAAALRRGGRKRGADLRAAAIAQALRAPQLRQPPLIEQAMSRQALALLTTLNAECDNAEQLGQASIEAFRSHPDHAIITSFPGLGELTGARILGELGDDRAREATGQEQPTRRRRLRLGLRHHGQNRPTQRPLRPATSPRRPPRRRPTTPVQPHDRPTPPPPTNPPTLRPDQRLLGTSATTTTIHSLTLSKIGGLAARVQPFRPEGRGCKACSPALCPTPRAGSRLGAP
jgi:Transposase